MNRANIAMLERAAKALGEFLDELVFVGGATIELWITDPGAPEFRPTDDVDVIVEIASHRDYYRFEDRLRRAGFQNHVGDGVICRFHQPDASLVLDVMPTKSSILGFENRWQREAFPRALPIELPSRTQIRAAPPPYLLATKLEAFWSRGKGDLYGSRDFEDIVSLIDGREELVQEVAQCSEDLRGYVSGQLQELSRAEFFDSAAEGALKGGPETRERYETIVKSRIEAITKS